MLEDNVIYVGDIGVEGTAMSINTRNIANILNDLNYKVFFVCDGFNNRKIISDEKKEYTYTKKKINIPKISGIEYFLEEATGTKKIRLLKNLIKENKPKFVILYKVSGEYSVLKYCKKFNIPVILERTDWFDYCDHKSLIGKILQFQLNCTYKYLDKKANGVISISQYFDDYYKKLGINSLYLPPIFDFDLNKKIYRSDSEKIKLVYAGSLGTKKDLIFPIINALKIINTNEVNFTLDIIGISEEELKKRVNDFNFENIGIRLHGRLPNESTKKIIQKCDFSFLLRENKRYAKAGFSTKFVESMTLGVPVICTKVGGADSIINDFVDGILLENNEVNTLVATFERILKMNKEEILTMKINSYKTACNKFHKNNYKDKMESFINEICSN